MKRSFYQAIALCCCFIFLMAVVPGLDGRWVGNLKTPDGNEFNVAYNFKTDGPVLTGTAESPDGQVSIDSGKVDGNKFTFQVTVDGNVYPHSGIMYDDSCGVDIDFGGGSIVHETLVRDTTAAVTNQ